MVAEHQSHTDYEQADATRRVNRIGVYVYGVVVPLSLALAYLMTDPYITAIEGLIAGFTALGFWRDTRPSKDLGHTPVLAVLTHLVTRIVYLVLGAAGLIVSLSTGSVFLTVVAVFAGILLIAGPIVFWTLTHPLSQ